MTRHTDKRSEWEEGMLENSSYWDVDILMEHRAEKRAEIEELQKTLWSRIWNWRKIRRLEREYEKIRYQ